MLCPRLACHPADQQCSRSMGRLPRERDSPPPDRHGCTAVSDSTCVACSGAGTLLADPDVRADARAAAPHRSQCSWSRIAPAFHDRDVHSVAMTVVRTPPSPPAGCNHCSLASLAQPPSPLLPSVKVARRLAPGGRPRPGGGRRPWGRHADSKVWQLARHRSRAAAAPRVVQNVHVFRSRGPLPRPAAPRARRPPRVEISLRTPSQGRKLRR